MSKTWNALMWAGESGKESVREATKGEALSPNTGERHPARPQPIVHVPPGAEGQGIERLDFSALPEIEAQELKRMVYHNAPSSAGADKFRLLRMRLRNLRALGNLKTVLVTSPLPQDGKTTVVLNLATALTEQRAKKVLVIDSDLHRRGVDERLGLDSTAGIAECLQDGVDPTTILHRVEPLGWYLLSAGKIGVESPSELLRPAGVSGLLQRLAPHFDWILLDSPPVLPLSDSLGLAQVVDGCLFVSRAGQTPTKAIEDAIELLGRKRIIGLVVNGLERSSQSYSKYQNYYRSSRSTESSDG